MTSCDGRNALGHKPREQFVTRCDGRNAPGLRTCGHVRPVVTGKGFWGWGPVGMRGAFRRPERAEAAAPWAFVTRCGGRQAPGLGPVGICDPL